MGARREWKFEDRELTEALPRRERARLVAMVIGPGTCSVCNGIVLTPGGTRHTWPCKPPAIRNGTEIEYTAKLKSQPKSGRPVSPEARAKISAAVKARFTDPAVRARHAEAMRLGWERRRAAR